ncbi:hypothetical protein [Natrialbaceae archaeon AArc-T1-2]|uniref:hypothetical protein n=1 Tax=Natrialbaceae archaeon AArc-T1-2 TaxID=3053904 RepID=UPI00255ACFD0|nr:hypothetical protein [Natrialbaceae archaeon AArc-T1-2]WIV66563.1 hypothetical protein QQ977_12800 [Natrialbaceae archaeon AArc-T1-2]
MTGTQPTFESKRDYAVYLLGEHKLIVAGALIAAAILIAYRGIDVSIPPWAAAFSVAYILFGIPAYLAGSNTGRRFDVQEWERVFHINGATDERELYFVEKEYWQENKEVTGPPPRRVNDEQDFEARKVEYMDDVDKIRVQGSRFDETKDGDMVSSRTLVKEIHETLEDSHAKLKDIRDKWSRMSIDMKEATINQIAEGFERGVNPGSGKVQAIWKEAEQDLDEQIDEEIPGITHDHVAEDDEVWDAYVENPESPESNPGEERP